MTDRFGDRMAKMRWWKLEWDRRARTHQSRADPNLSVPTEGQRQQEHGEKRDAKRKKLTERKQGSRSKDL